MNLADLMELTANAQVMAEAKGLTPQEYEVYAIGQRGVIYDVKSWSPADHNRGGVALILRGTWPLKPLATDE